ADTVHKGTSLAGWHVLGAATWRAENGEYVGRPTASDGGWLVLDASLQDVGLFAHFRCTGGCKTGVLLRAEKAADGMKGLYVALAGEDVASYAVTIDAQGKERSRERLRPAGGQVRFAPPPPPPPASALPHPRLLPPRQPAAVAAGVDAPARHPTSRSPHRPAA